MEKRTSPRSCQAEVSLEVHNKLPPDVEFVQSVDGRRVFEDPHGNLVFGVRNRATRRQYFSTLSLPLPSDHNEMIEVMRTAILAAIDRVLSDPTGVCT